MSSSSDEENEVGLRVEYGGEDSDVDYSVAVNLKYDPDDEYRKPRYVHDPKVEAVTQHRGYKGGFIKAKAGGVRGVDTSGPIDLSAEAVGPQGYVGTGLNEDGLYVGGEGSVGKAEYHAGYVGLGVQGPNAEARVKAGKKGVDLHAEANLGEGKVEVGPVTLGAGVGVNGTFQANSRAVGAIIPSVGGAVVGKDGVEVAFGPFEFKIGW